MHFFLTTFGSAGDVFPMMGLALELRRRGHEVTLATNETFASLAQRHDLSFEVLGTREDFIACISHADLWHPRKAFAHVYRSLQPGLKTQYELLARHAARKPTVAIANCFSFGAYLAQEKLNIPLVTHHCQPAVLWSDFEPPTLPGLFGPRWLKRFCYNVGVRFFIDPVVLPFLNPWRLELGLPPIRQIARWWHSPFGVLGMFPEWFSPPQPDWPAKIQLTNFPLWNDQSQGTLSAEVEAFMQAGEPPIVFTPGSANVHGQTFFTAAVEACCRMKRRALFLTEYPDQLPQPLPKDILHLRYVPLDAVLPRAAAFVHHGGVGSTSQALAAGIPQVIMPLAHDQFDNAARVTRLGVGTSLTVRQFSAARLASRLHDLISSQAVQSACRQCAERLKVRDGLSRSVDVLEEWVGPL